MSFPTDKRGEPVREQGTLYTLFYRFTKFSKNSTKENFISFLILRRLTLKCLYLCSN